MGCFYRKSTIKRYYLSLLHMSNTLKRHVFSNLTKDAFKNFGNRDARDDKIVSIFYWLRKFPGVTIASKE